MTPAHPKKNDASASPCYCNCQGKHASVKAGVRFIDAVEEMKQQTLGCMFSLSRLAPKCMRLVQVVVVLGTVLSIHSIPFVCILRVIKFLENNNKKGYKQGN